MKDGKSNFEMAYEKWNKELSGRIVDIKFVIDDELYRTYHWDGGNVLRINNPKYRRELMDGSHVVVTNDNEMYHVSSGWLYISVKYRKDPVGEDKPAKEEHGGPRVTFEEWHKERYDPWGCIHPNYRVSCSFSELCEMVEEYVRGCVDMR
jgi:hypothetical protein